MRSAFAFRLTRPSSLRPWLVFAVARLDDAVNRKRKPTVHSNGAPAPAKARAAAGAGAFLVEWAAGEGASSSTSAARFDLVLAAVGRTGDAAGLRLPAAGVALRPGGALAVQGKVAVQGPPGAAATANPKM